MRLLHRYHIISVLIIILVFGSSVSPQVTALAQSHAAITLFRPNTVFYSVSWSPDGTKIATGGSDGALSIWSALTGERLTSLYEHFRLDPSGAGQEVMAVAWSPTGDEIADGGADGKIVIWDVANLSAAYPRQWLFIGDKVSLANALTTLAWNADGVHLASGSIFKSAATWNTIEGTQIINLRYRFATDSVQAIEWLGTTNEVLAVTGLESKIFNGLTGELVRDISHPDFLLRDASLSPDDSQLAIATAFNTAIILDTMTGNIQRTLNHTDVHKVAWNPVSNLVASGSWDRTIKVWNVDSGELLATLIGNHTLIYDLEWSPDGSYLASAAGNKVEIWDMKSDIGN